MLTQPTIITCPHCELPLSRHVTDYSCVRRHTFPIAREGYVNLLSQTRPGDTTPMLAARRRFLDAGYFLPIAKALANNFLEHAYFDLFGSCATDTSSISIIDAGCGEGYYLGQFQHSLASTNLQFPLDYYGFDSSKDAVKLAARRYRIATFFVGDITRRWQIIAGASCGILNIFAPRNFAEFARVLRRNGLLLTIIPTQQHLSELRDIYPILAIEQHKQARIRTQAEPWFSLSHTQMIEYQQSFTHSAMVDAITMSPSYWHKRESIATSINGMNSRSVTVSTQLLVFQRR